jgi:hypothetical protein|tara:strand:- start:155 stop:358 length:204 start_codon:yes stop_codon:yes gene_type:complete
MRPSLRRSSVFKCTFGVAAVGLEGVDSGLREQLRAIPNAIAKTNNLIPQAGKRIAASQAALVHTPSR